MKIVEMIGVRALRIHLQSKCIPRIHGRLFSVGGLCCGCGIASAPRPPL